MIGSSVVFTEVCGLGIAIFFLIVGVTLSRNSEKQNRLMYIGFALLGFVLLIGIGSITTVAYVNRSSLRHLPVENVLQVQIGEEVVTDKDKIKQITDTFPNIQSFLPNHELAPTTPFVVKLKTGEIYQFRIKYRKVKHYIDGVVIKFGDNWNTGYAFSEELLDVIQELGITLPEERP